MKVYMYKKRFLSRCFIKTVPIVFFTILVLVSITEKARADIIALLPTDFFIMVMEEKDRIEIINKFLTQNDDNDNDDKAFIFFDYSPDLSEIPDLDLTGFSEETQCSDTQCIVYFDMPYIIITEFRVFWSYPTYEKEKKIRDRIELITRFHEQNSDKDFLILDYDTDSGETEVFEIPDFADISELIKWLESSTGWELDGQYSAADQIADLIEFFDESLENGDLEGTGFTPRLAKWRLNRMRRLLEGAWGSIYEDEVQKSCIYLTLAYLRCDDRIIPLPDFVQGYAKEELADRIMELMETLGCKLY